MYRPKCIFDLTDPVHAAQATFWKRDRLALLEHKSANRSGPDQASGRTILHPAASCASYVANEYENLWWSRRGFKE